MRSAHAQRLAAHFRRNSATTVTITPDLSSVLSIPSLAVAPLPTTTSPATITNPDAPPLTFSLSLESGTAQITTPAQPLPSGLPSRIVLPTLLDLNQVTSQYQGITITFDEDLNWSFVVDSQLSSSQIFAWLPVIIQTALNLTCKIRAPSFLHIN
ncbi:hypothetical protein C0993_000967 [Termitomyces sp. T159_Od127]|nr:hypothetical protein C0993_000967 [Termitomyces sp. T159_Od127]